MCLQRGPRPLAGKKVKFVTKIRSLVSYIVSLTPRNDAVTMVSLLVYKYLESRD